MNRGTPPTQHCPGCGRTDMAGITHVCPPLDTRQPIQTAITGTFSTTPVFVTQDSTTYVVEGLPRA